MDRTVKSHFKNKGSDRLRCMLIMLAVRRTRTSSWYYMMVRSTRDDRMWAKVSKLRANRMLAETQNTTRSSPSTSRVFSISVMLIFRRGDSGPDSNHSPQRIWTSSVCSCGTKTRSLTKEWAGESHDSSRNVLRCCCCLTSFLGLTTDVWLDSAARTWT